LFQTRSKAFRVLGLVLIFINIIVLIMYLRLHLQASDLMNQIAISG